MDWFIIPQGMSVHSARVSNIDIHGPIIFRGELPYNFAPRDID